MALDFIIEEYIKSTEAEKSNIDNYPGVDLSLGPEYSKDAIKSNLIKLHENIIDPIRNAFPPYTNSANKDIWITSGYRSKDVNSLPKIKGVEGSQHMFGYAVDIISIKYQSSFLFNWCYNNLPAWNQMIWEYPEKGDWSTGSRKPSWLHISYKEGENNKTTSLATTREDLHEMVENEFSIRKGVYTHGIKLADQNFI